jgi:uncharacterized membrane protein (TIGR02234 family)
VGAGLVVLAAGRTWATARVAGAGGSGAVPATGSSVAPGTTALALVAAAGGVALLTSGRVLRLVVAVVLALAGAGITVLALMSAADPVGAVAPAVSRATGTTQAPDAGSAHVTGWPWAAAAGGALVAAGGVLALVRGRTWAAPSRRYDRDAGPSASPVPAVGTAATAAARDASLDAWDRLSDGDDPTDTGPKGA